MSAVAVGTKAEGLLRLPLWWTPTFTLLNLTAATALEQGRPTDDGLSGRLKACAEGPQLEQLFAEAPEGVLVRSSALDEGMSSRGLFKSVHVNFPSFVTVAEAMSEIWKHAAAVQDDPDPIPLVVQRFVRPQLLGHLSNEIRLRADRRDWTVEIQGESTVARSGGMRALKKDRVPLAEVDLACASSDDLIGVLRRVAGAFTSVGHRHHLEWLWDGGRLWVVQHDEVAEIRSAEPRAIGWAHEFPSLACFRPATPDDAAFPKVRCIADYTAAGLAHQDLRLLADPELFTVLRAGGDVLELESDLSVLAERRAVIRTDVRRGENQDFDVLRARTDAGCSAGELLVFLRQTLHGLTQAGVGLDDVVFLVHPFVPADASAWSLAAPSSSQVRVDATYGLPDGLLYYPHDSYVVDTRSASIRQRLRCKSRILTSDVAGQWRDEPLGSPWNWRATLSGGEARVIAQMSKRLADHLGRAVEIMFFVRTHTLSGGADVLPWVHRDGSHRPARPAATTSFFPSQEALVRNFADLQKVSETMTDAASSADRVLVQLRPEASILHDSSFLDELVAVCAAKHCSIELEGSTLSHIYYELVRAGLHVEVQDPISTSGAEPVSFGKLVRDLIPSNIAARGEHVVSYQASGDELQSLLRAKVIEEAFEIAQAHSSDELLEEIGDALDVLASLCALTGTDLAAVSEWAEQKRRTRGGFNMGQVLVETREPTLEEATAGDRPRYPVTEDVRLQVERRRSAFPDTVVVGEQDTRIPYEVQLARPDGIVVSIDGVDLELEFQTDGAVVRRAVPTEHPDQLELGL
jgi:predicted house-cleaning noncanonical NTP pyrophosphatase (MazG superfamily)